MVRIYTKAPLKERFDKMVCPESNSGCFLWTGSVRHNGYGQIWDGEKIEYSHRAAWRLANGDIPDGLFVLHRCDTPSCVNPTHLFLGTHNDNMKDMAAKGRKAEGERHGMVKLTANQAAEIRGASGLHKEIAARYCVSRALVSLIRSRDIWRNS